MNPLVTEFFPKSIINLSLSLTNYDVRQLYINILFVEAINQKLSCLIPSRLIVTAGEYITLFTCSGLHQIHKVVHQLITSTSFTQNLENENDFVLPSNAKSISILLQPIPEDYGVDLRKFIDVCLQISTSPLPPWIEIRRRNNFRLIYTAMRVSISIILPKSVYNRQQMKIKTALSGYQQVKGVGLIY